MNSKLRVKAFSIDYVFTELIKRALDQFHESYTIEIHSLFSEAKAFDDETALDFIIVDDAIIGTSSYELISFLRLNKRITCPIFYFGAAEYDGERKALLTGASHFFKKPFNPLEVAEAFANLKSS